MLGDRSFAKRQILRFDHGYAIESLPAAQPALPRPATVAQLADVAPAEDVAAARESGHGVPSWVANDSKVQAHAYCSAPAAHWRHAFTLYAACGFQQDAAVGSVLGRLACMVLLPCCGPTVNAPTLNVCKCGQRDIVTVRRSHAAMCSAAPSALTVVVFSARPSLAAL